MLPCLHELLNDGWRWRTSLRVAAGVVGGLVERLKVVEGHGGQALTKCSQVSLVELFVADLPPTSHSEDSIQSSPSVRHWIQDGNRGVAVSMPLGRPPEEGGSQDRHMIPQKVSGRGGGLYGGGKSHALDQCEISHLEVR